MADQALIFPRDLTPELREVLGLMLWHTTPLAGALRAGGAEIRRKVEDEQAATLHWLLLIALEHGPDWRRVAIERIRELRSRIEAERSASAGTAPPA